MAKKLSQAKAIEMLKNPPHGMALTDKQKQYFTDVATAEPPPLAKMGGWLEKYNDGGPVQPNYNDAQASTGPGYVGTGYDTTGRNYSPAWGGQFQNGGFLQPNDWRLPQGYKIPNRDSSTELAASIGGEDGEPAYLIPTFKHGQPLKDPIAEYKKTGEHLGGPFKTWQEAEKFGEMRHTYVEKGQSIPSPYKTWGEMQMGGSMPGSVGFMYARTAGAAPDNGKYAKKTKASAQNGKEMSFYQNGLDWKPNNISKNGSVIKDDRGQWAHPGEITEINSNNITMEGVDYPVLGVSDTGDTQLMQPGEDYKFKGKKVIEYPQAQDGWLSKYEQQPQTLSKSDIEKRLALEENIKNQKANKAQSTISKYTPKAGDQERMNAARDAYRADEAKPLNRAASSKYAANAMENIVEPMVNIEMAMGAGKLAKPALEAAGKYLTEETALKNAYKLNPYAFKANPEAYYHRSPNLDNIVNKETGLLQGFGQSPAGREFSERAYSRDIGNVAMRSDGTYSSINLLKPANSNLYFSKGVPLDGGRYNSPKLGLTGQGYPGPYMVEVKDVPMGSSVKGRKPKTYAPSRPEGYAVSHRPISIDEAKFYKEDWLKGYQEVPKPESNFKSEINWGNWNKEIPDNPQLMNEYNAIEQTTKANGSWMKNPDGSAFQGTPEQFVQQNSENFKKAFGNSKLLNPDGSPWILEHGSPKRFDTFDESKFQLGDAGYSGSGIYTVPPKGSADSYTISGRRFHTGDIEPTTYKLYGQGNNPITSEELIKLGTNSPAGKEMDLFNFHRKSAPLNEQLLDYDVAIHNQNRGIARVRDLDDAWEVVFPTNKQLKSATGNNGMFDMSNPNIYKALVPAVVGSAALQQKKNGGWLNKYAEGGIINNDIINDNSIINNIDTHINTGGYTTPSEDINDINMKVKTLGVNSNTPTPNKQVKTNKELRFEDIPTKDKKKIIIDNFSPKFDYIVEGDKTYYKTKGGDTWADISNNKSARNNLLKFIDKNNYWAGYSSGEKEELHPIAQPTKSTPAPVSSSPTYKPSDILTTDLSFPGQKKPSEVTPVLAIQPVHKTIKEDPGFFTKMKDAVTSTYNETGKTFDNFGKHIDDAVNDVKKSIESGANTAIQTAEDSYHTLVNGVKRKFATHTGNDDDAAISTTKTDIPKTVKEWYGNKTGPEISAVVDDPNHEGRQFKQQVLPTSNIKFGVRNRGEYKNIQTDGLEVTTFNPFTKDKLPDNTSVLALDPGGNLHTGAYKDFKNEKGFTFSKTFKNNIVDFSENNGKAEYIDGAKSGNPKYKQPKIKVLNDDGKLIDGSLNVLVKDDSKKNYYGSIQGGRVLFVNPTTKEQYLVSGSVDHIKEKFKELKGNNKYLEAYTLDNGTYSRGLSYKDKNLTPERLKSYDLENTGGGNGLYIMDYKQPVNKYKEEYIENMPNVRTVNDDTYKKGHALKNEVKNIVLHHTAYTNPNTNEEEVKKQYMTKDNNSSHVVIQENGKRTVYASPEQVTRHAGESEWKGRKNVNDFGVGVEFQGDTNKKPLTSQQIESFIEYYTPIAKKYNLSLSDIVTHQMVAPGRKPDIAEKEYSRILSYMKNKGYK